MLLVFNLGDNSVKFIVDGVHEIIRVCWHWSRPMDFFARSFLFSFDELLQLAAELEKLSDLKNIFCILLFQLQLILLLEFLFLSNLLPHKVTHHYWFIIF